MEETALRPKPMVEVGGWPLLWHIMRWYASQGFDDFVVAAGYKREVIETYFDGRTGAARRWRVEVVDTGAETMTGGRLLRLAPRLEDGTFMCTYGDGLADVDLRALLAFHRRHGRIATLSAVRPPLRTRQLAFDGNVVAGVRAEAPGRVNGGYFVFEAALLGYVAAESEPLETGALTRLAAAGELMAYRHDGFWQCMDTAAERDLLEGLWRSGQGPWVPSEAGAAATDLAAARF
jgi:glucose-1-phosphate cytidylyltransferase